jgi:hypothetical protein
VIPTRVRRYLFTHYTPEILLNPVFEDLRKPKAPNRSPSGALVLVVPEQRCGLEAIIKYLYLTKTLR